MSYQSEAQHILSSLTYLIILLLHIRKHIYVKVPLIAKPLGQRLLLPHRYKTNVMARWMAQNVHGGHVFTLEKGSHTTRRLSHTHTHTPALPFTPVDVDPSACQASGTPSVANQAPTPEPDGKRPGACPLTRVCQPVDSAGGSPTFPCPSALLTGAGRHGTPLHPTHAHQHM